MFPSSARIELLQEDIKLTILKDFQTTLEQQSINKTPLKLIAAYIQAPVKATTFDPIMEFSDIFSEKSLTNTTTQRTKNALLNQTYQPRKKYQSSSYPYHRKILFTI